MGWGLPALGLPDERTTNTVPEKLKRSLRRFHRRHASFRRRQLRELVRLVRHGPDELDSQDERQPTRQELRVDAEFRQAIEEVETP